MKIAFGNQQSDTWLRNRVGRITGSKLADVCNYLVIKSRAGESSAKRNNYRMQLIAERLTGRAADTYVSPAMEHGTDTEDEAAAYYEGVMRQMVEPVGFVLHPKYDFTGASPDRLVGAEGVLEIKCPATTTHLEYIDAGKVPDEYLPQVAWELACTGRKWADFVSFDPRIHAESLRFFYRRVGRDELEWTLPGKEEIKLTGEAVIDYFTSEVLKFNAEIEYFFAERSIKPIAPFAVQLQEEAAEPASDDSYDHSKDFAEQEYDFLYAGKSALSDTP